MTAGTGFYGVPVDSDRIVFVVDQSGSMDSSFVFRGEDEDGERRTSTHEASARSP